jgi:hypothetical protein
MKTDIDSLSAELPEPYVWGVPGYGDVGYYSRDQLTQALAARDAKWQGEVELQRSDAIRNAKIAVNFKAERDAALQDLHDEKNRCLALLEDAKHWQAELRKAEADHKHLVMERDAARDKALEEAAVYADEMGMITGPEIRALKATYIAGTPGSPMYLLNEELNAANREVESLKAELAALKAQEPVAWVTMWLGPDGETKPVFSPSKHKPTYGEPLDSVLNIYPLYAAPVPAQEPAYTKGHCKELGHRDGCQLPNVQCGYPACDRKPI